METTIQLWVAALATALCLVLLRRLPTVAALRWWAYSWASGLAALLLALLAAAGQAVLPAELVLVLRLLSDCAQILCVGGGLLRLAGTHRKRTLLSLAFSLVVFLGFVAVAFVRDAGQSVDALAASRNFVMPIICGLLAIHFWQPHGPSKTDSSVGSMVLLGICAIGILDGAVVFQIIPGLGPEAAKFVNWSTLTVIGQFGAALAMASMAIIEVQARNAELHTRSEGLLALVDATPYGLCEIDSDGSIKFTNRAAAATLASDGQSLAGVAIHDVLGLQEDESAPDTAERILRPTTFVPEAKARVRNADGGEKSVEWSSSPIHQDGRTTGAVLTLRDITQRESADRFHRVRSEILELIARNKPVEQSAKLLAAAVEERLPGFYCSVLVCDGDWFRVAASPRLPDEFRTALNRVPSSRFIPGENRKGAVGLTSWDKIFLLLGSQYGFHGTWVEAMVSTANEVLGVIVLNHTVATTLEPTERRVVGEAARLGALAAEHRRSFERLMHQGHHDSLTGLPNRVLLEDRLKQALARAERTQKQLALLAIDLDRFKYINDTFGHDTGDLFLQQISVRLASRIRAADTLARTGGDEFTAILSEIEDANDAEKVAESLTASLIDAFEVEGRTLYGAVSIGIAVYPQDGTDAESLRRNADRALYRAKAKGRNTIQSYSSEDAREDANRVDIEVQLHRAIKQGNFELQYQPQFTCDGQLVGFEALLRFCHPKLGAVPPSRFIPIAEESGLILPIGEWVLRETCRQIKEWEDKGMRPVRVAVNGSPLQFAQADFCETVAKVLDASQVRPDLLELELTEGTLMQSLRDSAEQMQSLAALGVGLAVDDFGTGYSSLSYLHQLPIHVLKIDRSFISKMLEPGGTRSIVEAIISLAHGLGLKTIAEGVEEEDQLAILKAADCDFIQGFIFSRPLAAIDASRLLWQSTFGEPGAAHSAQPSGSSVQIRTAAHPAHRGLGADPRPTRPRPMALTYPLPARK